MIRYRCARPPNACTVPLFPFVSLFFPARGSYSDHSTVAFYPSSSPTRNDRYRTGTYCTQLVEFTTTATATDGGSTWAGHLEISPG